MSTEKVTNQKKEKKKKNAKMYSYDHHNLVPFFSPVYLTQIFHQDETRLSEVTLIYKSTNCQSETIRGLCFSRTHAQILLSQIFARPDVWAQTGYLWRTRLFFHFYVPNYLFFLYHFFSFFLLISGLIKFV